MKNWTGNRKSTFVTLGASNHTDKERESNDFYATDPIAIDKLVKAIHLPHKIWECAFMPMASGIFLSLLVPIRDFMIAMMVLFGLNLVFGIVAAVFNGEEWSWKKFGMFFVCCAVFFVTVAALFIIGHFLHSDTEALFCVKWVCIAATYLFVTNILKNLRRMLVAGTPFYKLVDYAYYALTIGFVEKFPMFKKYQEYKNNKENGNEGNQIRAAADGNA